MLLAESFDHLKFVIQDREVVVAMGEKVVFLLVFFCFSAHRGASTGMENEMPRTSRVRSDYISGCVDVSSLLSFLTNILSCPVHDFFRPQPIRNASLFLLRVVLHDWPDHLARRILLHLREAAVEGEMGTKLMIADFVLPLACADDFGVGLRRRKDGGDEVDNLIVEGAEMALAPPPLLANLGKASSHVYWMDLTVSLLYDQADWRCLKTVL
jgi:hypothetical protein